MFATLIRKNVKGLTAVAVLVAGAQAAQANSAVFQQTVRSTAWVISPISKEKGDSLGSGALVDVQNRLVVTNYHVVETRKDAIVFFPSFEDGEPVSLKSFYINNASKLAIKGKVLVAEPKRDLALIQLDRLPEGMQAIPMAKRSVSPGSAIHVIGNSDVNNGTLWRYSNGFVRGVFPKTIKTGNATVKEFTINARMVESQIPGNPGDSGGPVVNDQGELVAIHQGTNPSQQLVSFGVDISEVRGILANANRPATNEVAAEDEGAAVEDGPVTTPAPAPAPTPAPAPKVEDIAPKPMPVPPPAAKAPPIAAEDDTPAPKPAPIKAPSVLKPAPKKATPCWDKPCHKTYVRKGCH